MTLKSILYFILSVFLFVSCSTRKNTALSRGYHNLTARYNGFYYSTLNLNEGIYKTEQGNKDNFEKVIPVYIYPTPEKAKANAADFDKAIKKASLCIQRHTIKDSKGSEITSAGKWIDNNWINIGVSHFYKREYYSSLEALEYVVRSYPKSKDKYRAMIWLIKVNNEIASVSTSESLISLLKNEKSLPSKVKRELPIVTADYYIRRGQNTEAIAKLMDACKNKNLITGVPKSQRARYNFIIAQLLEQSKEVKRSIRYYQNTIKLKPNYDLVFYSKINIARLFDVKRSNPAKTKKDLLKMAKEFKNSEYFDVIYYTLGEIEEKETNIGQAMVYYKKSIQTSVTNRSQKALSYLKMGEIHFDLTHYEPSEAYYDSALTTLPKDHPDYENIQARKKTLSTLVGYIKTISREDSLQRVAKMSEIERTMFIDRLIADKEREELKRQREMEAAQNSQSQGNSSPAFGNTPAPAFGNNGGATFYFYNPATVSYGISDFNRRWGNRKLEDNWRRSNKALTFQDTPESGKDTSNSNAAEVKNPAKLREVYLKDLPMNDTLVRKSNNRIIKSYYLMGSLYREELHNNKKAIGSFEQLNSRFPTNKYEVNTYYLMYRMYLEAKNQPKADYYKDKIINEFPDSEFAALLKNPDYAKEMGAEKSELENAYTDAYANYKAENYSKAYTLSNDAIINFGKNSYSPKFLFIRAMCVAKTKSIDSCEIELKLLIAKYPDSEVGPLANDVLQAIKKQKNPELFQTNTSANPVDSFVVDMYSEHSFVAIVPDDSKIVDAFKSRLNTFNTSYYSEKQFKLTNTLFGDGKQMILLKSFKDAKECMNYYLNFEKDPDVFKGDIKREMFELFPILNGNVPIFYKSKMVANYKQFFDENYQQLDPKNQIKK